jgi:hypothetical protein
LKQHDIDQAENERLKLLINNLQTEVVPKLLSEQQELLEEIRNLKAMLNEKALNLHIISCPSGHALCRRTTPKPRNLVLTGRHIWCSACKVMLDIPKGFYTCEQSCNFDLCDECHKKMAQRNFEGSS